MTAQIHDSIQIEGKQFSVVGGYGDGMFDPASLGLYLVSFVPSYWRSYVCEYEVDHEHLLLTGYSVIEAVRKARIKIRACSH